MLLFFNRGPVRNYEFRTPTVDYPAGTTRLMRRYRFPVGVTVLRKDGTYRTVEVPTQDELNAADTVYQGGRVHVVDDLEADALTAAGYGEGLVSLT